MLHWIYPCLLCCLLVGTSLTTSGCATAKSGISNSTQLRARHLITATDDFIVEVYHNGVRVPHAKRELLVERFGATVEKINVEVQRGDWLVFNVVNNRLRWGGAYYFGVAGVLGENECGFVSDLDSGDWSVCDDPAAQQRFIKSKDYLSDNRPAKVEFPWGDGDNYMRQFAGNQWNGEPIWGRERNTWIKVVVK